MKTISRAGGAVAALAVGAALALTPQSAQAATPQAEGATAWLAGQLPDDNIIKNGEYPDFGLTIDLALAFQGAGTQPAALGDVVNSLESNPKTIDEYATNVGFGDREDSQIAGATAKLATLVQLVDGNAKDFAGHNLVEEVEGLVVDDVDSDDFGRAKDRSSYGENSNAIGQSFAVRSLSSAGSDEADAAADYLVKQQCDSGVFRINMTDAGCGEVGPEDTTSIDTTAFAIEALIVAEDAGVEGLSGPIADAADHLADVQAGDGSFSDLGTANSNSTGLAAAALAATGNDAAAAKAAGWIAKLQATECTPKLGGEAGAVAFDQAAFEIAQGEGITEQSRDQFTRATAQAALGLASAPAPVVGSIDSIKLAVSDQKPDQGDSITVTATGRDASCNSLGDVTDDVTLTSSVATDVIDGNTVTFPTASPHVITATHTSGVTASVTVQVAPTAVDDEDDATDPTDVTSGSAPAANAVQASSQLPETGAPFEMWQGLVAVAMVVLGAGIVFAARRRGSVPASVDPR